MAAEVPSRCNMVIMFPFGQRESQSASLVKLTSAKVIDKCERSLAYIKAYRENEFKKLIVKERERIVNGFFHKLFKRPVPSDEEVVRIIEQPSGDVFNVPETFWINIQFHKSEEIAKRLLNAAKQADEIYVSTEDLEYLS